VAMKDLVLFAFGAAGALHATYEEYGYAYRNQNGQDDSILHKPMRQSLHFRSPIRGRRTLLSMRLSFAEGYGVVFKDGTPIFKV